MTDSPPSPLAIGRREHREAALAWLFESDMNGDAIATVVERNRLDEDDYDVEIALGVAAHIDHLDELVDDVANEWSVDRMPGIDRTILRIATWELLHSPEVPTSAAGGLHLTLRVATPRRRTGIPQVLGLRTSLPWVSCHRLSITAKIVPPG